MQPELPERRFHMVCISLSHVMTSVHVYAARDNEFDVVLIDTAGRMQDNEVR
jgi:signal recognition particle GTPase